jgi:acetyltransferase-like isoleucine patch superfamily enzyme
MSSRRRALLGRDGSSTIRAVAQAVIRRYAVRGGVTLGTDVHIGIGTTIWAPTSFVVENDVYIGKGCTIGVDGVIGTGTMLGNNVGLIGRHDHDVSVVGLPVNRSPWVGDPEYDRTGRNLSVVVGRDVWIGYGATVLSGVTLGRGCVVAAGALVTSDVAPYDIVAGVPAKPAGRRFTDQQIVEHERLLSERRG